MGDRVFIRAMCDKIAVALIYEGGCTITEFDLKEAKAVQAHLNKAVVALETGASCHETLSKLLSNV